MAFPEAPPPPPGFVRDFVLVGDGWEKDGDYNTRRVADRAAAADASIGRPTHRAPAALEDDPVYQRHRADFERYHTRYVSPDAARDALRVKIDPDQP